MQLLYDTTQLQLHTHVQFTRKKLLQQSWQLSRNTHSEDLTCCVFMHVIYMPSKNTLGVKKGEAKSKAPVNVKITSESTGN